MRCEEAFGDSRGKREYSHIRVFLDDEDLEDFDKQHEDIVEQEVEAEDDEEKKQEETED